MVSTGGNVRPYIGDPDPNNVLASGTVISGVVNFVNAAHTTMNVGTLNVSGGLTVSGGANLQNVSGFFWRGTHTSGSGGNIGGASKVSGNLHTEKGYVRFEMSGQAIYIPYWVSA